MLLLLPGTGQGLNCGHLVGNSNAGRRQRWSREHLENFQRLGRDGMGGKLLQEPYPCLAEGHPTQGLPGVGFTHALQTPGDLQRASQGSVKASRKVYTHEAGLCTMAGRLPEARLPGGPGGGCFPRKMRCPKQHGVERRPSPMSSAASRASL